MWVYKIAMILLVVGALNWGFTAFRFNLVEKIFGASFITKAIYILVAVSALFVVFRRDFYLPFLGQTVLPCASLQEKTPAGATREVRIQVTPHAKVLFWAAEPETEHLKKVSDWRKAYLGFENAGVTMAGEDGTAVLKVREPQPYSVPFKGMLSPHIHYRVCDGSMGGGLLGRVETVFLKKEEDEAFSGLVRWG